jgi:hypothetical protein
MRICSSLSGKLRQALKRPESQMLRQIACRLHAVCHRVKNSNVAHVACSSIRWIRIYRVRARS